MRNHQVARRYAKALMDVVQDLNTVDAVADDLALIDRALAGSRELVLMLASPVVSEGRKSAVLRELFGSHVSTVTLTFLDLLVRKNREVQLQGMVEEFLRLRDALRGVVRVAVTAATPLAESQETALRKELERRLGKTVVLQTTRDTSIVGGLVVKVGDTVLDASVRRQLAMLRECFTGTGRYTSH